MANDCEPEKARPASQADKKLKGSSKTSLRISQDDSCIPSCLETVFRRDFIPWNVHTKPSAIDPPAPIQLHHSDDRFFNNKISETINAFPSKYQPREGFDAYKLRATTFKLDKDLDKLNQYGTTYSAEYPKRLVRPRIKTIDDPLKSFVPQGDYEKCRNHTSDYILNYRDLDVRNNKPSRATNKHQEGDPTITGDNRVHSFCSSSSQQFQGVIQPRVPAFPRPTVTYIPTGDSREKEYQSTCVNSYQWQNPVNSSYDKKSVVEKLQKTNFNLIDHLQTFDTYRSTSIDAFKSDFRTAKFSKVVKDRNQSHFPRGDEDPLRTTNRLSMTTNKFHFDNPITLPAKIISGANLRTRSKVQFGDPPQMGNFYSTTNASTFTPNSVTCEKNERPDLTFRSSVPLKYYGQETNLPVTKSDFKNPCQRKQIPNEAAVSFVRDSHIIEPTGEKYFTTEHQDQYIPKKPPIRVPIDSGRLQKSTVPLGDLQVL